MRNIPEKSTPIINEIIEKLARTKLSAYEYMVLFAVLRKTYGWDKKSDWISGTQLSELTGIMRHHCSRTTTKLASKNIIVKNGRKVGINKNVNEWKIPKQVVPKQVQKNTQTGISDIPKQVHTKETITKETYTKESVFMLEEDFEKFWAAYPKKKLKKDAKEIFLKLKRELLTEILDAVEAQKNSKEWTESTTYIPNPTTWLEKERWTDQLEELKDHKDMTDEECWKMMKADPEILTAQHKKFYKEDVERWVDLNVKYG